MKLDSSTSVYNMGDTSIRVKQVVEVNKIILKKLESFIQQGNKWEKNNYGQEDFYKSFLEKIVKLETENGMELFKDFSRYKNYTFPENGKIGMRGRTLTNALVKVGLINSKRQLSEVGDKYLKSDLKVADQIESLLGLSVDNLIYFRQFLKLRIYHFQNDSFFYNFRFAIKFLCEYDNVPQKDFLKILESIIPNQTEEDLERIIIEYKKVSENQLTFDEYYGEIFAKTLKTEEELLEAKQIFERKDYSAKDFTKLFTNRDNGETSLIYKEFVIALINLQEGSSEIKEKAFKEIKKFSKDEKIKKAFSSGKSPFKLGKNDTIMDFLENNKDNPLLSSNHYNKYLQFIFSKHNDLIREYSDMGRRAFQISGIINFDNKLVNLNNKWVIKPLISIIGEKFSLTGEESYLRYEENIESSWFKDISLIEIFSITKKQIEKLFKEIGTKFKEKDITKINELINKEHEKEYQNFVERKFPKNKIIEILKYISNRNDDEVFKLVTDNATIPTIYEYILTIAWYYLSENKFNLYKAFQVSLDGNKLPLSHRGGGAGDIEIINSKYALLIEATLMDKNNQKRGELEPVIRHSTNFAIDNQDKNTQTIFIANELDNNVLNIFRGLQFIQQNGTYNVDNYVDGLNIFAFTTNEIIQLLEKDIKDLKIIKEINNSLDRYPIKIQNNWRNIIIQKILQ